MTQTLAAPPLPPIAPGSLLSVADLSIPDVSAILSLTAEIEQMPHAQRAQMLSGRRIALLFYESSTRTRTSFELAAKGLGATTTLVSDKSSSIEKGESLKDTGLTLRALGAESIILRHNLSGAPWLLARATGLPVLNAGDGTHEHPSQALLDLRTILTRLKLFRQNDCHPDRSAQGGVEGPAVCVTPDSLQGITVVITGDILHSRVARSNAMLLPRLGARVVLCGPEPLLPETALGLGPDIESLGIDGLGAGIDRPVTAGPGIEIERNFDRALQQADVVMMLRIQSERLAGLDLDLARYIAQYQLNADRLAQTQPDALVLHPGPMIRGLEITGEVADSPNSAIEDQVAHGLSIRSALLVRALRNFH